MISCICYCISVVLNRAWCDQTKRVRMETLSEAGKGTWMPKRSSRMCCANWKCPRRYLRCCTHARIECMFVCLFVCVHMCSTCAPHHTAQYVCSYRSFLSRIGCSLRHRSALQRPLRMVWVWVCFASLSRRLRHSFLSFSTLLWSPFVLSRSSVCPLVLVCVIHFYSFCPTYPY